MLSGINLVIDSLTRATQRLLREKHNYTLDYTPVEKCEITIKYLLTSLLNEN